MVSKYIETIDDVRGKKFGDDTLKRGDLHLGQKIWDKRGNYFGLRFRIYTLT